MSTASVLIDSGPQYGYVARDERKSLGAVDPAVTLAPVMKLCFSPGSCSLSPHIALREPGVPFELERDILLVLTLTQDLMGTIQPISRQINQMSEIESSA